LQQAGNRPLVFSHALYAGAEFGQPAAQHGGGIAAGRIEERSNVG
jgi:hypothetical protein